ncbi:MAG: ribosomal protein S18-alanine N-acetyltransferase [Plesiomonas sp.]|uniref:ribosomal protein S18-alanine N-acetyltransferase n=1 Tax=Plesiomonas sp. TaxID=2486279 RepID=UPI003F2B3F1B
MSVQITTLEADEWPLAYAIEVAAHAFPWSEKTFQDNFGERYINVKLLKDGQLVGFAITQVILDEATLFNIAIAPQWQGQGLGLQLLRHLGELLATQDVLTLWLEVRESNLRARALYEREGFNEVTVRRNYYPCAQGRENAVIMALPLG